MSMFVMLIAEAKHGFSCRALKRLNKEKFYYKQKPKNSTEFTFTPAAFHTDLFSWNWVELLKVLLDISRFLCF